MRTTRRTSLVGIIASLFARRSSAKGQVRSVGEDGFVDLDLPLTEMRRTQSGALRLEAKGQYENQVVGFAFEILPEWLEKPLENNEAVFYWGVVLLRSIGPPSNAFVSLLSRLYGKSVAPQPMITEIRTEAVGLNSDPRKTEKMPIHMKLFFHSDVEDRYAEVFLNVDIAKKLVQFHEKDLDYRENLLRALQDHA